MSNLYELYEFNQEDDFLKRNLQILILEVACSNGHLKCLEKAKKMFYDWMNEGKVISPDFKSIVYYHGVQGGDEREWDFVLKQYLRTKVPSERLVLLNALCATQQSELIDKMLHYTLNPAIIKSQDVFLVFRYIATSTSHGRYHAWYFLQMNWNVFVKQFSHQFHTLERIISDVISGFTTEHSLQQAKGFFTREKLEGARGVKRALDAALETVGTTISWSRTNKRPIEKWLEDVHE